MSGFAYRRGVLHCERVAVADAAAQFGTPLYLYSAGLLRERFRAFREAFQGHDVLICCSMKANGNLALCRILCEEGAGFDVVSGNELRKALEAGADPKKVVFAGVGKREEELQLGLDAGILMFNVESLGELELLARLAGRREGCAPVALRLNPDVEPRTHAYLTTGRRSNKFGLAAESMREAIRRLAASRDVLRLLGVHVHVGSQLMQVEPFVEGVRHAVAFVQEARRAGLQPEWIDVGGGLGIPYRGEPVVPVRSYAEALGPLLSEVGVKCIVEPGRFIMGPTGLLVTRVLYVKSAPASHFTVCDAGMNDLLRPSLYGAYHRIWPVRTAPEVEGAPPDEDSWAGETRETDVVGPICETGDFLALGRRLPLVEPEELLAVFDAGAYGAAMSSNYNARGRAAEALVEGDRIRLVARRETYEELIRREAEAGE